MSNDDITPALTADEWAQLTARDDATDAVVGREPIEPLPDAGLYVLDTTVGTYLAITAPRMLHALAALALHGQPFGFTEQDVAIVDKMIAFRETDRTESEAGGGNTANADDDLYWLRSLRDRIAALLPPRETP